MTAAAPPRLQLTQVTKSFPGVLANDAVDMRVDAGEIHALLGENGAGKSTLVKMIYGVMRPDAGLMTLNGDAFNPVKPAQARAQGVGMVFQHFSLFEALTVAENVALGIPPDLAGSDLDERVREISQTYGLPLDPSRAVGDLSVGERQRVEIVRALLQNPSLLIMDEPTSVLTPQEVDRLFNTLRRLKAEGVSILYISHKLDEVRTLCDHATILRGGRVVAHCVPSQESVASMAELMLGERLVPATAIQEQNNLPIRLQVQGVRLASESPFGVGLSGVDLQARGGEILGIAGVAGNGQDVLTDVLLGERQPDAGSILFDQRDITALGPSRRRQLGMTGTPEERLGHAAVPGLSLAENTLLSGRERQRLAPKSIVSRAQIEEFAQQIITTFGVKTPSHQTPAASLSGGNLQKFVVGREVLQQPEVYVVCQPTWGVDAHAAAMIRKALVDLAKGGCAVVVISQDLDELLEISTRICAIYMGQISDTVVATQVNAEQLGRMMLGADIEHA